MFIAPRKPDFGLLIVLAIILITLACSALPGENNPQRISPQPENPPGNPGEWYRIYFTDPGSPESRTLRGGIDGELAEAIDQARVSVDLAVYDLNLWSLRDALLRADRRGVSVRVVTESDNLDTPEIQALAEEGIPVLGDRREGSMHNKFVVIDRMDVWTGSMNFTINGAYENNNNLVRVRSPRLAEDYLVEFEEMFIADQFGQGSPANTPFPTVTVNGDTVEVYFSPEDGTAARLIELIQAAEQSVYFMAYSFTSDDLATAMLRSMEQGFVVVGVMDESQYHSNVGSEFDRLRSAGLDVRLDGNADNMHHKVLIIDRQIVVTGSYNFSANAENRNDENTLILHSVEIAGQFMEEFDKIFSAAKP